MKRQSIFDMKFSDVYPLLIQKAERKNRTRSDVYEVTSWLTGYTAEQIERIGVERSWQYLENADLVLAVFDTSRLLDDEDQALLDAMSWKCPKCGREFSKQDQSHYCEKPKTIDDYILLQDENIRPKLNEVREILRSAIPDAEERISWSMPTYWKGQNLIHFAASKKHIGIYPGGEATTIFADELTGIDVSKGTIRLPYDKELPADLIAKIAKWCREKYGK